MQNRIEHQKAVADKVLATLELLDPHCIVAGGAPRDWYLDRVATDIDVFLYAPQLRTINTRVGTLNSLGFSITGAYENWKKSELYEHNKYVTQMYNTEVEREKVQLIFVSNPTFISVIDTFPISISKAWYKKQQIKFTDEFKHSVNNKIIWKTVDSYLDSDKYITKIKNKFSDYKYVTKEEAQKIIEAANKDLVIKELKEKVIELESVNRELRIKLRSATNNFFDSW